MTNYYFSAKLPVRYSEYPSPARPLPPLSNRLKKKNCENYPGTLYFFIHVDLTLSYEEHAVIVLIWHFLMIITRIRVEGGRGSKDLLVPVRRTLCNGCAFCSALSVIFVLQEFQIQITVQVPG